MKTLDEQFNSGGFNFTMIKREGKVAMFSKRRKAWKPEINSSYEVVIVRTNPARKTAIRDIPACECMPSSVDWGRLGWTFKDHESANIRFRELVTQRQDAPFSPTQGLA